MKSSPLSTQRFTFSMNGILTLLVLGELNDVSAEISQFKIGVPVAFELFDELRFVLLLRD